MLACDLLCPLRRLGGQNLRNCIQNRVVGHVDFFPELNKDLGVIL